MWAGLSWFHLIQPRETFQPQNPLWGEQVTSPTFYKIKTLATIVVKIINPTAALDNSEALKKEKNYIIESVRLHKNHL